MESLVGKPNSRHRRTGRRTSARLPRCDAALAFELGRAGTLPALPDAEFPARLRRDAEFLVEVAGSVPAARALAGLSAGEFRIAHRFAYTAGALVATRVPAAARMLRRIGRILAAEDATCGSRPPRCAACGLPKRIGSGRAASVCPQCSRWLTHGRAVTRNGVVVDMLLRARVRAAKPSMQARREDGRHA